MFRSFLRDSAIYVLPTLASRGLAFFLIPIYTRVLDPADYGSLDLFTAFSSIVALTVALEVSQGVARFYQQEQVRSRRVLYASSAFWFSLVSNSAFALLMVATTPIVAPLVMGREGLEGAFMIGVTQIWITSVFYLVQGQLRWEFQSVKFAIVSCVMVFFSAAISAWLTIIEGWALPGLMLGTVVGTTLASFLGLWWLRESIKFRIDLAVLEEMLRFSTPLVVSSVAVWVNLYVDRLMISHFMTLQEVGLYGMAYRISSISGLAMVAFQSALGPLIYAHFQEPNTPKALAKIFRLFLLVALGFCLALSISAGSIVNIMTTPEFHASAPVVPLLVPAVMLSGMYIFAPGINIAKKTYHTIWINVSGAIASIIFNIILIPIFGIYGAAASTLISSAIVFISYLILGQLYYPIPHEWRKLAWATALTTLLVSVCLLAPQSDLTFWVTGSFVLLIYAAASLCIGLVRVDEIRAAYRLVLSALNSLRMH